MADNTRHILHVVGARPNIMKLGPLWGALNAVSSVRQSIIHTGQHYDAALSGQLFEDFGLPKPDANLDTGKLGPAIQFGEIVTRLSPYLERMKPSLVIVYGDVRSTPAAAISAFYSGVPVAHYEAGLRNFHRTYPEEFNRIATDAFCDLLFPMEPASRDNLVRERRSEHNIFLDGDLMCDAARLMTQRYPAPPAELGLPARYAVFTSHRPNNVDALDTLTSVVAAIERLAAKVPVVFPVHPRTEARLKEHRLLNRLAANKNVRLLPPLRYSVFAPMLKGGAVAVSDSGGIATEAVHFRVPHLYMHTKTEHPLAVECGGMVCCGLDLENIEQEATRALAGGFSISVPDIWDGHAAGRIAGHIADFLDTKNR